jgi:hypothetical protein
MTLDNVQKSYDYINVPSSRTFRYHLYVLLSKGFALCCEMLASETELHCKATAGNESVKGIAFEMINCRVQGLRH